MPLRTLVLGGVFVATGVVLPIAFHLVGMGGSTFLPMHIPVLLAGFILGPRPGLLVGVLCPLISGLLTGMPPMSPPILPIMMVELAAYGWAIGWLYNHGNRLFLSLIGAMLIGRIAAGFGAYMAAILLGFKVPAWVYISGAIAKGVPGILIQLVLIPMIVKVWYSVNPIKGGEKCGT